MKTLSNISLRNGNNNDGDISWVEQFNDQTAFLVNHLEGLGAMTIKQKGYIDTLKQMNKAQNEKMQQLQLQVEKHRGEALKAQHELLKYQIEDLKRHTQIDNNNCNGIQTIGDNKVDK